MITDGGSIKVHTLWDLFCLGGGVQRRIVLVLEKLGGVCLSGGKGRLHNDLQLRTTGLTQTRLPVIPGPEW